MITSETTSANTNETTTNSAASYLTLDEIRNHLNEKNISGFEKQIIDSLIASIEKKENQIEINNLSKELISLFNLTQEKNNLKKIFTIQINHFQPMSRMQKASGYDKPDFEKIKIFVLKVMTPELSLEEHQTLIASSTEMLSQNLQEDISNIIVEATKILISKISEHEKTVFIDSLIDSTKSQDGLSQHKKLLNILQEINLSFSNFSEKASLHFTKTISSCLKDPNQKIRTETLSFLPTLFSISIPNGWLKKITHFVYKGFLSSDEKIQETTFGAMKIFLPRADKEDLNKLITTIKNLIAGAPQNYEIGLKSAAILIPYLSSQEILDNFMERITITILFEDENIQDAAFNALKSLKNTIYNEMNPDQQDYFIEKIIAALQSENASIRDEAFKLTQQIFVGFSEKMRLAFIKKIATESLTLKNQDIQKIVIETITGIAQNIPQESIENLIENIIPLSLDKKTSLDFINSVSHLTSEEQKKKLANKVSSNLGDNDKNSCNPTSKKRGVEEASISNNNEEEAVTKKLKKTDDRPSNSFNSLLLTTLTPKEIHDLYQKSSLDEKNEFINLFSTSLASNNLYIREAVLEKIAAVVPLLSNDTAKLLLKPITDACRSKCLKTQKNALEILEKIVPFIEKDKIGGLTELLSEAIASPHWAIQKSAITQATLINTLIEKEKLENFSEEDQKKIISLGNKIKKARFSPNKDVRKAACQSFTQAFPEGSEDNKKNKELNKELNEEIISFVEPMLHSFIPDIRNAGIEIIRKLIADEKLKDSQKTAIDASIYKTFNSTKNRDIQETLYNAMKILKPKISEFPEFLLKEALFLYKEKRNEDVREYYSFFARNSLHRQKAEKLEAASALINEIETNKFNKDKVPEAAQNGRLSSIIKEYSKFKP